MIAIIGPIDRGWQEQARYLARTTWPNEALKILHPDQLAGIADLQLEGITGAVLDGARADLLAALGEKALRVEVLPLASPEPQPEAVTEPDAPTRKRRGADS